MHCPVCEDHGGSCCKRERVDDAEQRHPGPLDIGRAADHLAVALSVVEAMPDAVAPQMAKVLRRCLSWLSKRRRAAETAQRSAGAYDGNEHADELNGRR